MRRRSAGEGLSGMGRAMRILLISDDPDDPTVGASKVPRKLRDEFRRMGHVCDVLFSEDLGERPRAERLRFVVSPLLSYRAVARLWRTSGPYDVVDAAGAEGWVISLAARMHRLRREQGRPAVVARSHGLEHIYFRELVEDHRAGLLRKPWWRQWWFPATRLRQVAWSFWLADRAIMLNSGGRAIARERRWQPPECIDLISHGVDAERILHAPASDAPRGAGVLFSGAWYTGKGTVYLARAHALLLRQGVHIPLTLLGGGIGYPFEQVERHVRSTFAPESQPWLTVLPRLSDENAVFALYRTHDFLVCPSTAEGFGMVVLEALSQRLAVVCTSAVGVSERLRAETNALIVPARDVEALAAAMARLWQDAGLRRALAEAGYQWARGYTWRYAAENTLAAYAAALARVAPRSGVQ